MFSYSAWRKVWLSTGGQLPDEDALNLCKFPAEHQSIRANEEMLGELTTAIVYCWGVTE